MLWLSLIFAFIPLLLLTITSVFPMLNFSPLLSIPICQPSHLLCISSSVSVTTARSSANNSLHGSPHLNSSLITSSTKINRNGLSPDHWCRPTLLGNFRFMCLISASYFDLDVLVWMWMSVCVWCEHVTGILRCFALYPANTSRAHSVERIKLTDIARPKKHYLKWLRGNYSRSKQF